MIALFLKWFDFRAYIQLLTAKKEQTALKDFKKKMEERARDGLTDCIVPAENECMIIPWAKKEGFKIKEYTMGCFVEWGIENSAEGTGDKL